MRPDISSDHLGDLGKLGITSKENLRCSWSTPEGGRPAKCQYAVMRGLGREISYMVASGWVTALTYRQSEFPAAAGVKRVVSTPYASRQFGRGGCLKGVWPTESYITAIRGEWEAEQTWKACRTFDNLASYFRTFWSMSVRSSTLLIAFVLAHCFSAPSIPSKSLTLHETTNGE